MATPPLPFAIPGPVSSTPAAPNRALCPQPLLNEWAFKPGNGCMCLSWEPEANDADDAQILEAGCAGTGHRHRINDVVFPVQRRTGSTRMVRLILNIGEG